MLSRFRNKPSKIFSYNFRKLSSYEFMPIRSSIPLIIKGSLKTQAMMPLFLS